MLLENLKVGRIAMHEIFKRGSDRKLVEPSYATALENLPAAAMATFQMRVTDALSAQSKSVEMRVINFADDSMVALSEAVIAEHSDNDEAFLEISKTIAQRLASAQLSSALPGGVVVVFEGSFGVPTRRFVGIIKAETQSGFRRHKDAESIVTQFLNDIFLTPAQRLYKVGVLISGKPEAGRSGWSAFVFDSNITSSHRESAAQYFYEGFLGCTFSENGAYETQKFFDLTKDFIKKSGLTLDDRRDLTDALYTFIKSEQAPTFTANEFSEKYLPVPLRDAFAAHLNNKNFPTRAVVRDTSDMGSRLKRRRFKFGPEIEFSASPEALREKRADIDQLNAAEVGGPSDETWTKIIIRQRMTDQQ